MESFVIRMRIRGKNRERRSISQWQMELRIYLPLKNRIKWRTKEGRRDSRLLRPRCCLQKYKKIRKKKNKKKNKKRNNLDARELVKKCKQVTLTILLSDLTSFDIKENLYLD